MGVWYRDEGTVRGFVAGEGLGSGSGYRVGSVGVGEDCGFVGFFFYYYVCFKGNFENLIEKIYNILTENDICYFLERGFCNIKKC